VKVFAVSMVRDEADIIEYTVSHLLAHGIEKVLISDHFSVDGTREILEGMPSVVVGRYGDKAYNQAEEINRLIGVARESGADVVIPFDADELFITKDDRMLVDVISNIPDGIDSLQVGVVNHISTYLDNKDELNPFLRMNRRLKDKTWSWEKVIVRATPDMKVVMGNHKALVGERVSTDSIEVRHFPYRSVGQLVTKIKNGSESLGKTDLPETTGSHWRSLGLMLNQYGEGSLERYYNSNLFANESRIDHTVEDPAPYMEFAKI
jgi:glycosyltransferase involved in cell wall biosynthesis